MADHCGCCHEHCHELPKKTTTFPLTMENLEKGVKNMNIIIDMIDTRQDEKEEENRGLPPKIQAPPQVLALLKKQGKLNLPLPQQNVNLRLSFREFGKGNLEIVEPGELVSSERLKINQGFKGL